MRIAAVTVNVILVRGTVALLRPFLRSLQARTKEVRFRLVANGCRAPEVVALRQLCESDGRFEVLPLSRRVMPHGQVLDELLRRASAPVLAFMDSDCFVTEDPFGRVVEELGTAQATFSGEPCWRAHWPRRLPEGYTRLTDAYRSLDDGTPVGSTYFAVYDRRVVASCVANTGVSFVPYHRSQLPWAIRTELDRLAPGVQYYDVGKALNLLLGSRGARLTDLELPGLWHVGGLSSWRLSQARRRVLTFLDWLGVRGALRELRRALAVGSPAEVSLPEAERERVAHFTRCRAAVNEHVTATLRHVALGELPPARFEHPDERLALAVAELVAKIRQLNASLAVTAAEKRNLAAGRRSGWSSTRES